jgi:hypothetical protein
VGLQGATVLAVRRPRSTASVWGVRRDNLIRLSVHHRFEQAVTRSEREEADARHQVTACASVSVGITFVSCAVDSSRWSHRKSTSCCAMSPVCRRYAGRENDASRAPCCAYDCKHVTMASLVHRQAIA